MTRLVPGYNLSMVASPDARVVVGDLFFR